MQDLINQYSALMAPQVQKASRAVKASVFGAGLGSGSPYQAGLGEIQAQNLANIGQYGMNLAQQGLGAQREERLIGEQRSAQQAEAAAQRAYQEQMIRLQNELSKGMSAEEWARQQPFMEAQLTGMYGGKETLAGRQFALQKALQEAELTGLFNNAPTMAKLFGEAGLTGMYGDTKTLALRQLEEQIAQNALQNALAEAGLTGLYKGQQTMQARQNLLANQLALLPLISQGVLGQDAFSNLGLGNNPFGQIISQAQLQREAYKNSPEYQFAALYGLTPEKMQMMAAVDPSALRAIMQRSAPAGAWGWLS
jgi:hypothetical protein